MKMNLIECEDKLYAKGKCIGTVKEVLDKLLNARQEFERYQEQTLEMLYFPYRKYPDYLDIDDNPTSDSMA